MPKANGGSRKVPLRQGCGNREVLLQGRSRQDHRGVEFLRQRLLGPRGLEQLQAALPAAIVWPCTSLVAMVPAATSA